ncbi:acyltransferase family protein [Bifidobacterium sp. AGR2158]|uniref:acyltransferase family protein n=1 Tax=Bifidobacterium sp. AGR2158 TaxID=1280675 RepID=UPI0009DBACFB|nr:acyltransferase [Bifidobacterium sp. AGR2158]
MPQARSHACPHHPTRNSSIELLRIIAMLLIVAHHSIVHNAFSVTAMPPSISAFLFLILQSETTGSIGVIVFFGISAWFLSANKTPSVRSSLKRIWLTEREMLFYAWGILLLRVLSNHTMPTASLIAHSLLPGITGMWWYMTAYIVFLAFYPSLTVGLRHIGPRLHGVLCIITIAILGISGLSPINLLQIQAHNFMFFILLYIIISYYRWYLPILNMHITKLVLIVGLTVFFIPIITLQILGITLHIEALRLHSAVFAGSGKASALLIGFALFNIGIQKKFFSRIVNTIASTTLGVYLIHEDPFVRSPLWQYWLNFAPLTRQSAWVAIITAFGSIFATFIACVFIDLMRQRLFAFTINRHKGAWFDKLWDAIKQTPICQRLIIRLDTMDRKSHITSDKATSAI